MIADDIAGHSRATPQREYRATLPNGAVIDLHRGGIYAMPMMAKLTLPGESPVALQGPSTWFDSDSVSETGYRALIVEHRVLARPELLREGGPALDRTDPAAAVLTVCRARLATALMRERVARRAYVCAECLQRLTRTAPRGGFGGRYVVIEEDCRHVAPYALGLSQIIEAHPELALELAGLITPCGDRFVLRREVFTMAVAEWLLGAEEARRRATPWGYSEWRWRPKPRRRWSAAGNEALPARSRDAVIFAAEAWGALGDAPRFGWDPARPTDPPSWDLDASPPSRELAVMVPEQFRQAPPQPAPQKDIPEITPKKTPKITTRVTPKKTPEPIAQEAPAEAPQGVFTRKDLEAMGHTAAAQKRMLAAGVLVRDGFGWYRFAKTPG